MIAIRQGNGSKVRKSHMPRLVIAGALLAALASAAPQSAAHARGAGTEKASAEKREVLVSTDWLAEHTADESVVILHIGRKEDYEKEHIEGARLFSVRGIMEEIPGGLSHELAPVERIDSIFGASGIRNDSHVVLCWGDPMAATFIGRAFMTLEYAGMAGRTSVLDGGLPLWKKEKRPVTAAVPEYGKTDFVPRVNGEIIVDKTWISERLDDPRMVLIDTRPPEYYSGAYKDPRFTRHGHLPGAYNLVFTRVMDDSKEPRFLPPAELEKIFSEFNVNNSSLIVPYCDTGVWAGQIYLAARILGLESRFYDASFQEWSADGALEVIEPVNVPAAR